MDQQVNSQPTNQVAQLTQESSNDILRALKLFMSDGNIIELRCPETKKGTKSGYFDNLNAAVKWTTFLNGNVPFVYVTINPVNPDLLARAANRIKDYSKYTTGDNDIVRRRFFLIDLDAERPAGISSTNEEHEAALTKALLIRDFFKEEGWPEPGLFDSSNGAHLLFAIDLPNDEESKKLIEKCLKSIDALFSDDKNQKPRILVDQKVFNAARIVKLYGTWSQKGDSTPERPHRLSKILSLPEKLEIVSVDKLNSLAAMYVEPIRETKGYSGDDFNLETWIKEHNLQVYKTKSWKNATIYVLEQCPFDSSHGRDSRITKFNNGGISFGCFHNGCSGNDWYALRDLIEPGWKDRKENNDFQKNIQSNNLTNKKIKIPTGFTASQLMKTEFKDPLWVISGVLCEGLSILAGKPKLGKSWLCLNFAVAVAAGGKALGNISVDKAEVLYLALEDTPRRLKKRLAIVLQDTPAPEGFYIFNDWLKTDRGGLEQLNNWLLSHPKCKLVIIDTLAKIRKATNSINGIYQDDYAAIEGLKSIADKYGIAILLVHHLRKMTSEDPLEQVSGSTGLTGAADALMILKRERGRADASLFITGRDIEETGKALEFDKAICTWCVLGDAEEYRMTEERREILEVLKNSKEIMTPKEISQILRKNVGAVRKLLITLECAGLIKKVGYGKYFIGNSGDSSNSIHSGNSGNSSERVTELPQELPQELPHENAGSPERRGFSESVTRITAVTENDNFLAGCGPGDSWQ
ncbi:MAG: hypothetical protein A4E53_00097 [Pelotomaculum sp. PtaB.Bin104]|nr:MAG: hypothetical protein A4E53_00097 [Pelotomaculum sp. PtaB.Bin104]